MEPQFRGSVAAETVFKLFSMIVIRKFGSASLVEVDSDDILIWCQDARIALWKVISNLVFSSSYNRRK